MLFRSCADCGAPMTLVKGKNNKYYYCRAYTNKKICSKHVIRQENLYNEVQRLLNLKIFDNKKANELNIEIVNDYIDKVIVYEEEKVEVIIK